MNKANWDAIGGIVGGVSEAERDLLNRLQFALAKFSDSEFLQLLVLVGSKGPQVAPATVLVYILPARGRR